MVGISNISMLAGAGAADMAQVQASLSPAVLNQKYGQMTMDKVDAAAKDFESMFVSQMLEQMFGESSGEQAFGSSDTSDIYKNMLMDQYGKLITRAGGIGIATYVKQELLKQQEVKS